jgi:serine/threonine-protein kinase
MNELAAQIRADQRAQWLRGNRVLIESFLENNPNLNGQDETTLDLIYGEVLLREELGEKVDPEEYLRRFPRFADRLRRQFVVHEALRDSRTSDGRDTILLPGPGGAADTAPATRAAAAEMPALPGYEILAKLGTGSYGVVYKARQADLRRVVALKMIRFEEDLADPHRLALIRREAEAVAQLNHPNVVQIYDFGEHQGRPYFAMEYVEGGSLEQRLKAGPLPPQEAATMLETLAGALQAAHDKGVIHRDLKPGNVLLTPDGCPKVADFGLAKLLNTEASLIPSGAIVGTASYMAPEQAAGRGREVKEPADVYALGAILYHMLTGRPPFAGDTFANILSQVISREPNPPELGRAQCDLGAICLKCLEKEPARRYASAGALADDLRRFSDGQPTAARPRRWYENAWRGLRKRPWAGAAAALCVLVPMALPLLFPRPDPDRERKQAEALLAAGKPYVFDGKQTLPGPFQWVGVPGLVLDNPAEGDFLIESFGHRLLELVADPGSNHYLVTLEARHYSTEGNSEVGIFFGLRRSLTDPAGEKFGHYLLSFADHGLMARRGGEGAAALGYLQVATHVRQKEWDQSNEVRRSLMLRPGPGHKPGPWRKLGLKVTPNTLTVYWRDDQGQWQAVDRIDVRLLEKSMRWLTRTYPEMAGIPTGFSPRLGLGIYISEGSASFRRIEVTPLRDD